MTGPGTWYISVHFFVLSFIDSFFFLNLVGQCITGEIHRVSRKQPTKLAERSRALKITMAGKKGSFLVASLALATHCYRCRKCKDFYKKVFF